ncbi:uncharacterized protein [Eurosta solidaginis]|uniref:uncharacterized protein n=1 Tax=Eurosta solidaginis TaxID=178769 RepID=UPI00353142BA
MISFGCRYGKPHFHNQKLNCFVRLLSNKSFKTNKSVPKRAQLMKKDNVPQNYELVYHAPMELYITVAKNISTITTIFISSVALYSATANDFNIPTTSVDSWGLVSHPTDIWYFSCGFIFIAIAIRAFIARYPLRIYRFKESYIAIFDSQLPFRSLRHKYCKNEVKVVSNKFNPWNDSTIRLGKRTSLILSHYFRTPADYNQMMGY